MGLNEKRVFPKPVKLNLNKLNKLIKVELTFLPVQSWNLPVSKQLEELGKPKIIKMAIIVT
jgi:hypothetical protein